MRRWLRVLLAVLAGAVLSVLLASPASAHTVLVGSDPADGGRLAQSPAAVTLRFNEQVGLQLGYLRVVDPAGRRVDSGPVTHPGGVGSSVSVALKPGLGDGSYLASYRVISADSHPVAGSIRFVVGDGPLDAGSGASGSAPVERAVSTGLAISHWLSFAGVGLVGGSWLVFTLWPAGRRRRAIRTLVWSGWALAGLGAVCEYLLQG
ncbi:MAG TPA: copper resistance CopC family protein, partial [Jatrophihabitans sp.]|nr:copper resistance CopC family protein [Jatrophihabitans sp.]